MHRIRQLGSFLIPTWTQLILSLGGSLLILGLAYHTALASLITGAAGTQPAYFQASYQDQLNTVSQFGFTRDLTIGVFWAAVGIMGYFLVITIINLVIALRNEIVIDGMFADSGTLPSRFVEPLVRLALIFVFAILLALSLWILLPGLWLNLFGNLMLIGDTPLYIAEAVVAVLGLAVNIYSLGLLFLAIKNLDEVM